MIRVAAVADVHFGDDSSGALRPYLQRLPENADVFLIAGDLTRHGAAREAKVLAADIEASPVPTIIVLGNHDYHRDEQKAITDVMRDAGAIVLEGEGTVVEFASGRLGIAGVKGFGGGFAGACGTEFGEREMKSFIAHTRGHADDLKRALEALDADYADYKVELLHYAPVEDTVRGERLEIYPFLGSYLLAEAIDAVGANLAIHGHAHAGREKGSTPGGVPVRNVAQPLIQRAFNVYCLGSDGQTAC